MFVVAVLLVALLLTAYFHRPAPASVAPTRPGSPPRPRPSQRAAAARPAPMPELAPIAWPGTVADADALRARMRDRYVAARFPGLFGDGAGLRETERVIKAARHLFEEGASDGAYELLELALEQTAAGKPLRLAQLEIAYLSRDPLTFSRLAREFRAAWPGSAEWAEIARLGRLVAPGAPLFGYGAPRESHYGPPDTPNWIQASWDLTPAVLAADFHRAMGDAPAGEQA